jgi:signal transduction histidine kinase
MIIAAPTTHRIVERTRWYHFYFLLALFDLAVIVSSIALYHRSQRAFEDALAALNDVAGRARWAADLRRAVVEANAPGNDIFASRRPDDERARFTTLRARVDALMAATPSGLRESQFHTHLNAMFQAEEDVFRLFGDGHALLEDASARMAAMDRHQADALEVLGGLETTLRGEQRALLEEYRTRLALNTSVERFFFASVAIALAGMFWFGRILYRANARMMAEQRRLTEERQGRLAAIGQVCAAVAHGILNPLAGISAAAQVAQDSGAGGPTPETLRDILDESRRLEQRARRLLDFSKPLEPHLERCDLAPLVDDVARSLQRGHEQVTLKVQVAPGLALLADADLLWEVLAELGANAMRAMNDAGTVHFTATPEHGRIVIRVRDEGPGISQAAQQRLFELFFTTRPEGTGMGLATVRKLIQLQGGRVELESTSAKGSTFRVEMPRPPASAVSTRLRSTADAR